MICSWSTGNQLFGTTRHITRYTLAEIASVRYLKHQRGGKVVATMTMRNRVRMVADAILRPVGLQLSLVAPGPGREWFYPTAPSCQIPTLPHLLELFFGKRTSGIFVEVGAFDGISYSNTWGLAERGWEGWLVEPIPELAEKCRRNHHGIHPKVSIVQTAIGNRPGVVSLIVGGELTTANHAQASEYRDTAWARPLVTDTSIEVSMTTLDALLDERKIPAEFDLLVVDVEGYESAVFEGFTLSRWLPKMLIVELADTHPDLSVMARVDARLSAKIQANGYQIVYKDAINTVFLRKNLFNSTYALTPDESPV